MGARHSTQTRDTVGLRSVLASSARAFVAAHCVLGEDETTHADLFMEAFVRFLNNEHREITETMARKYCTVAWIAQIIEEECGESLQFVGVSPRLSKIPFAHPYTFKPTFVIGARLVHLRMLWPLNKP